MQDRVTILTESWRALRLPFQIPVGPGQMLERFVYAYWIAGEKVVLIDAGVKGSDAAILDGIRQAGRNLTGADTLVLSHSHPDHIGSARAIRASWQVTVAAHAAEHAWIENTDRQKRERPVPGFDLLVDGPVRVDRTLADGDRIDLGGGRALTVIHTPGHSPGSISLHLPDEGVLFTGDAVPQPGAMPIYDDAAEAARSLAKLLAVRDVKILASSWDIPRFGTDAEAAIRSGLTCLAGIHAAVVACLEVVPDLAPMDLCRQVVERLRLPAAAANPLVARSLASHVRLFREAGQRELIAES
jgi:hydroxyacylglutathione hydrolase